MIEKALAIVFGAGKQTDIAAQIFISRRVTKVHFQVELFVLSFCYTALFVAVKCTTARHNPGHICVQQTPRQVD